MGLVKFKDAINQAIQYSMHKDKSMMCFGLGVTDPKHIFGTTHGLEENFGSQRVFDMPTSEAIYPPLDHLLFPLIDCHIFH